MNSTQVMSGEEQTWEVAPYIPFDQLAKLREPFPPERIEKLPKPMWKGAWDQHKGSNCQVCGGYHVIQNCIHLDYVGHANCTDRLLEVDPLWTWEPMAYTEQGLPLFTDGGLWIKLTICGVTRIGFGDGKSIKEVIGDAIRNAAMRFGVALDLWAKVDLHEGVNAGDGKAQNDRGGARRGVDSGQGGSHRGAQTAQPADPPRAENQDALDELGSVCDSEGINRSDVRGLYVRWAAEQDRPDTDILDAAVTNIRDFAAHLIDRATGGVPSGPGAVDSEPRGADAIPGGEQEAGQEAVGDDGNTDGEPLF